MPDHYMIQAFIVGTDRTPFPDGTKPQYAGTLFYLSIPEIGFEQWHEHKLLQVVAVKMSDDPAVPAAVHVHHLKSPRLPRKDGFYFIIPTWGQCGPALVESRGGFFSADHTTGPLIPYTKVESWCEAVTKDGKTVPSGKWTKVNEFHSTD